MISRQDIRGPSVHLRRITPSRYSQPDWTELVLHPSLCRALVVATARKLSQQHLGFRPRSVIRLPRIALTTSLSGSAHCDTRLGGALRSSTDLPAVAFKALWMASCGITRRTQ